MYTAILLVMTMQGPMKGTDSLGPYVTEEECMARVEEMALHIKQNVPGGDSLQMQGWCELDDSKAI